MSNPIVDSSRLLARRSRSTCIGYDYGIPARALLAVDPSFINLLYEAKIVGCAYGFVNSRVTGEPMRAFYVVAQNGDAARQAFEVFRTWTEAMGADCVKLAVIVLTQGGYMADAPSEDQEWLSLSEQAGLSKTAASALFEQLIAGRRRAKGDDCDESAERRKSLMDALNVLTEVTDAIRTSLDGKAAPGAPLKQSRTPSPGNKKHSARRKRTT